MNLDPSPPANTSLGRLPASPSHSLGKVVLPRVQSEPRPDSDSFTNSLGGSLFVHSHQDTQKKREKKIVYLLFPLTHLLLGKI